MKKRSRKRTLRRLAVVLSLSLFMMTGCSSIPESAPSDNESSPDAGEETAEDMLISANSPFCYHDGILYYIKSRLGSGPNRLYYMDMESGENGILCSKPDCTHDSYDCNACIRSSGDSIIVYQDKIYWCTGEISADRTLMCAELDGTNHREVMTLDGDSEWLTGNRAFIGIYKDTLYRCGSGPTLRDGSPEMSMLLYRQPLRQGSEPEPLFTLENVHSTAARLYENKIYFSVSRFAGETPNDLSLYVCDLDSGEVKELFRKQEAKLSPYGIIVHDNKLILYNMPDIGIYSLEDGTYTEIGGGGEKRYYAATGTKIYDPVSRTEYRLRRLDESLITEGTIGEGLPFDLEKTFMLNQCFGSIGETLIFRYTEMLGSDNDSQLPEMREYVVAFDTDTLEWKLLWEGVIETEGVIALPLK